MRVQFGLLLIWAEEGTCRPPGSSALSDTFRKPWTSKVAGQGFMEVWLVRFAPARKRSSGEFKR
jgi:hypothetical protein